MTPLLETKALSKTFTVATLPGKPKRVVHALSDVSVSIAAGETLAIVGESGCGKSTLARCISGLETPSDGKIVVQGEDADTLLRREPMRFRRQVQMVFQDPFSSLNPRRRIGDTIGDALRLHDIVPRASRQDAVVALLERVGLSRDHLTRLPHELSGGQRQRVAIARAMAVQPALMVCDEPVSALDVSVQAQIINLLSDLQQANGLAYLFISHNLALVQHIADRIAVMYLGQIVEIGERGALSRELGHPYSRLLFSAVPKIGSERGARQAVANGSPPNPLDGTQHCRFHSRCPHVQPRCLSLMPALSYVKDRWVRCHRAEELMT